MHAAITGDEDIRSKLGITLEEAIKIFWRELLIWQHVYFPTTIDESVLNLVNDTQDALKARILADADTKTYDLEIYALLESLEHPIDHLFRICLPGVTLINEEEKRNVHEYDILSLVLTNQGKVEVWIWGVTTELNWGPKRNKDQAKIQELKDRLGTRWTGDVRTVGNYVHIDQGHICLEIDG